MQGNSEQNVFVSICQSANFVFFSFFRIIMCPIYQDEPVISGTPSEFTHEFCNTYRNEY